MVPGHPGVEVGCCGLVFTRCGFSSLSGSPSSPAFIPPPAPARSPSASPSGDALPLHRSSLVPGCPESPSGSSARESRDSAFCSRRQQEARSALGLGLPSVPRTQTRRVSIRVSERRTNHGEKRINPACAGVRSSRENARRSGLFPRWRFYLLLSSPLGTAFCYLPACKRSFYRDVPIVCKTERQEHQSLYWLSWIVIYRPKGT